MTKIQFTDGTTLVVDSDTLRIFLIENGIPYKDYVEYVVRKRLGQKLESYGDFVIFKRDRKDENSDKPEHLRFDMGGQRDGEGGMKENKAIFRLFNLPVTLRSSYDYEDKRPGEHSNIFIFHKGSPMLFERKKDGYLAEVKEYGGYGTVEILVELINRFAAHDIIENELKVL